MLILDTTNRSLEVVLGGAVAANQLPIVASFVDFTDSHVPGASQTQTNNTTPVTAVAAPAAATQRQLKFLSVRNSDTAAATLTLRYNDNSTLRIIWSGTLAVGDALLYTDGEGLRVIDSNGNIKQSTGGAAAHNLLSSTHADATAGTVARGDLITGQGATPSWSRLALGAAARYLRSDGTDAGWSILQAGDLPNPAGDVQGTYAATLVKQAGQDFRFAGVYTAALSADQQNYDVGLTTFIRLSAAGADRAVGGITGGSPGRLLIICNNGSANSVILNNEDTNSSAANRFALPNNIPIRPKTSLALIYEGGLGRWLSAHLAPYAAATAHGIPSGDSNGRLAAAWLGSGSPSSSNFLRGDQSWAAVGQPLSGATKNLILQRDTTSQVKATVDEIILQDSNQLTLRTLLLASGSVGQVHADIAQSGPSGLDSGLEAASTWYYVWVIARSSPYSGQAVTADALADTITLNSHGLAAGTPATFAGTTLPGGLAASTAYYVRDVTTNTFKLAATPGGIAIDLTSAGAAVTLTEVPALLLSTSSTAPTLPSGYSYKAMLGAVRNDASSNFVSFWQYQNHVTLAVTEVFNGLNDVASYTSQSVSTIVPPQAVWLTGAFGTDSGSASSRGMAVASDSSGNGVQYIHAGASSVGIDAFGGMVGNYRVRMLTAQTFWYKMQSDTAVLYTLNVTGWEY